jgi:hypothetical protein
VEKLTLKSDARTRNPKSRKKTKNVDFKARKKRN